MTYEAKYFDGQHAQSYTVRIDFVDNGISITCEALQKHWPFEETTIQAVPERGRPLILLHTGSRASLSIVDGPNAYRDIKNKLPVHHTPKFTIPLSAFSFIPLAVTAMAVIALFIIGSALVTRYAADHFPATLEAQIGQDAIQAITTHSHVCQSPEGVKALTNLTNSITAQLPPNLHYQVMVIRSKDVNAFAMPGGYVLILSGLINNTQTPEELAGVIAHELGHIVEKHPTQGIVNALGFKLLTMMLVGDSGGQSAAAAAGDLLQLRFSRDMERKADEHAIGFLQTAQVSTAGLINFFERLAKTEKGSDAFRYFSNHPATAERIATMRSLAGQNQKPTLPLLTDEEWHAIKTICPSQESTAGTKT